MEFRELKTFQVVAGLVSFNKAADVLHLAQSTVSAQIRSLENSLGKKLFYRTGKTISLTPSGVKLLKYTQKLINIENEIRSSLGNPGDKYGILSIKAPQSVSICIFPEILTDFQSAFPKIGFDIDWCTSHNLSDIFSTGTLDLAFLITDGYEDKDLLVEELTTVKLVFAGSASDELARKNKITIKDLHDKTLLFTKSECNYKKIIQKMLIQSDIKPEKVIEINSLEAIKRNLILDNGIAFLPEMAIAEELEKGLIKKLDWQDSGFNAKLIMIRGRGKYIPEPVQLFMNLVRKKIIKNQIL